MAGGHSSVATDSSNQRSWVWIPVVFKHIMLSASLCVLTCHKQSSAIATGHRYLASIQVIMHSWLHGMFRGMRKIWHPELPMVHILLSSPSLSPLLSLPSLPFSSFPSFLSLPSLPSSSGDEPQTETTIIQDIYIDPLDQCMEGIEDLATGILRTGKLCLQGEPGGMILTIDM